MSKQYKTREEWLQAAVGAMTSLFKASGYEVPQVRVACGWPVRGGLANKKRVLGECWSKTSSADKKAAQIFISPAIEEIDSDTGVLATLVHEVVHAVVGHKEGHNKVFGKCARAVGLEGKLTSTNAGEKLISEFSTWTAVLGEYPHSPLNGLKAPGKKQSTRLLKCECGGCGYTIRITQKWLDIGAPDCPSCLQKLEPAGTKEEGDDNE